MSVTFIKQLHVCWAVLWFYHSIEKATKIIHLIKSSATARMLHWLDHGQEQMLLKKVDFAKVYLNLISDKM